VAFREAFCLARIVAFGVDSDKRIERTICVNEL
jgi:hypothetical protein